MAKKTVHLADGRTTEGESVDFKPTSEPWGEYDLQDGTKLRMKLVVSEIVRLNGQYTPDGDPVYLVRASNVVTTQAPDALRKPGKPAPKPPGTYL